MEIKQVSHASFKKYGKVISGIDVSQLISHMKETPLPDDVVYVPSVKEFEELPCARQIECSLYGGMPIQIGYCNGNNHLLNAAEYHRDSEMNVAVTDLILILGMEQDIEEDNTYDTALMEAFFIPEGTLLEVYGTTLHYAPCNANDGGFRCVVVLPKGTNTILDFSVNDTKEDQLLFARNKWLLAHEDSGLSKDNAWIGLKGENLSV